MHRKLRDEPVFVFELDLQIITLKKRRGAVYDVRQLACRETMVDIVGHPCLQAEK